MSDNADKIIRGIYYNIQLDWSGWRKTEDGKPIADFVLLYCEEGKKPTYANLHGDIKSIVPLKNTRLAKSRAINEAAYALIQSNLDVLTSGKYYLVYAKGLFGYRKYPRWWKVSHAN